MINLLTILVLLLIQPKQLFACAEHTLSMDSASFGSPTILFFKMLFLFVATVPLGFIVGLAMKRFSRIGKAAALILVTTGLLMVGGYQVWACHGAATVGPILQQVYTAQVDYREANGVYAASFEQLDMMPPSDQYSYFLPAEMIPAKSIFPKEGVNLSRLPVGVFSTASADNFTVVAIGFAEPNRIDVWTMNQDKIFREWSVPAGAKIQSDPSVSTQEPLDGSTTPFEGSLAWMSFLLGSTTGFGFSVRKRMNFMHQDS